MRSRNLLALLALATVGCESIASAPPAIPATYVLEAPVTSQSEGIRFTLVTDTLRISTGGGAERRTRWEVEYPDRRDPVTARTSPYLYELQGGKIELTYICGPAELCAPGPHYIGQFTDGGLILEPAGSQAPMLRYRRID